MNMGSCKCCMSPASRTGSLQPLSLLLKLVSDHSRLQILCLLSRRQHCVCELMQYTQLSQSLISHHLGDLKNATLVFGHRQGQKAYYSLTPLGKSITNLLFKIKL